MIGAGIVRGPVVLRAGGPFMRALRGFCRARRVVTSGYPLQAVGSLRYDLLSSWGFATNEGIHETLLSSGRDYWSAGSDRSWDGRRKLFDVPGVQQSDMRLGR